MFFLPTAVLGVWFRGLLAIGLFVAAAWLARDAYERSRVPVTLIEPEARVDRADEVPREDRAPRIVERRFTFRPGFDRPTAEFLGALALLALCVGGGKLAYPLLLKTVKDEPHTERSPEFVRIDRPGGAVLHVEFFGPKDAPPIVLTHGWSMNGTAWYYVRKTLERDFRLIVWDLPGLGLSKRPDDGDYSMQALAGHLAAVVDLAGDRPAILVGHSIGGMISLSFARFDPVRFRRKVVGLSLVHTTYTNPVRTTQGASIYTALEKPVLIPMLWAMIALSPLVWVMNWLSYWNGSIHRSTAKSSFAGTETRGQLNFAASFAPHGSPAVLARGMLGMIGYDATETLATIAVPTLVVAGDRDITTLPEASERMQIDIPPAAMTILHPGRHLGFLERHAEFSDALAQFAHQCRTASFAAIGE